MRRTVRPFVKEFKNRSSKSPSRQTALAPEERAEPKPLLFGLGELASRPNGHDEGYEAALKAADAVFGKKVELAAPVLAEGPELSAPVGRVLPSLIETEFSADRRETAEHAKKPRAPRPKKTEAAEGAPPARRGRPPREKKAEAPRLPLERAVVERPPAKAAAESKPAAAARRNRRPIQLRWVLQTALKAGEKWKRRLPRAAR